MHTTATQSYLERNLACLGDANADVARAIRNHPSTNRINFAPTTSEGLTGTCDGRRLASAHRPRTEASRLIDRVDIVDHALFVVLGFGLGYHVEALASRVKKTGVILVFEPDIALLRSVFERIDMSEWLQSTLIVFLTDPADRAGLATKLKGAESIIAQGVTFIEHPANRARVEHDAATFSGTLSSFVATAKTTLLTTLVRSADTVQNLLWNIRHYALGAGIAHLHNAMKGAPAIVVSAGPSLHRTIHTLQAHNVRERCVIIAVQTTLKTLLRAGVRPHFVTALDYHEISSRFYEGLTPEDVEGVTLVIDPKAHPVIASSFPGRVCCCRSPFLDDLLGPCAMEKGALPAGATVAHLAFYLASYLGCNPIGFIGQDLGFTDGLYYAPGNAIHEVWAPELNPFNTIEMMEWQRIVRHRVHLSKVEDSEGKSIYTDAQMMAYLQQFERDFAEAQLRGIRVIDATGGGVRKQHAEAMSLEALLEQYATRSLPALPEWPADTGAARVASIEHRLTEVRRRLGRLVTLSRETRRHLEAMLKVQEDIVATNRLVDRVDACRRKVESIFDAFELLNQFNQLGVFKRQRADRKLQLSEDLSDIDRQRAMIERDLVNVEWTADAADALARMIDGSMPVLRGEAVAPWRDARRRGTSRELVSDDALESSPASASTSAEPPSASKSVGTESDTGLRVAALVPIAPDENTLGWARSLAADLGGMTVFERTLARIASCPSINEIVLLAPDDFDVEAHGSIAHLAKPIHVERCGASVFGPEFEAIAAARRFGATCWRGALAGLSAWDEVFAPGPMHNVMSARGIDAAVVVGPDWPLVDCTAETGIEAMLARLRAHSDRHNLLFSQGPPGRSACVVSARLMEELAARNRLSTIGGLLVYQPHAPQADPIARDANIPVEPEVRSLTARLTMDDDAMLACARSIIDDTTITNDARAIVSHLRAHMHRTTDAPRELVLDITHERPGCGEFHRRLPVAPNDAVMDVDRASMLFAQLDDPVRTTLTLGAIGDPMLHPSFDAIVSAAHDHGVGAVHIRTELRCARDMLDRLLAIDPAIVSIDLHADRAQTYERMMGVDTFRHVIESIEYLLEHRRRLSHHQGTSAWALPWVVPRMMRCRTTYEDIDTFYDRWQHRLGVALIEGPPGEPGALEAFSELAPAHPPQSVYDRVLSRRMTIRADGTVPLHEAQPSGERIPSIGSLCEESLSVLWARLLEGRSALPEHLRRTAWP